MSLIERLEAAEVGSRDLDAEVASALEDGEVVWIQNRYIEGSNPAIRRPSANHLVGFVNAPCYAYTTSLDAALALAERLNLNGPLVIHRNGPAEWGVTYIDDDTVYGPTPAIALCIAILKAKETK